MLKQTRSQVWQGIYIGEALTHCPGEKLHDRCQNFRLVPRYIPQYLSPSRLAKSEKQSLPYDQKRQIQIFFSHRDYVLAKSKNQSLPYGPKKTKSEISSHKDTKFRVFQMTRKDKIKFSFPP